MRCWAGEGDFLDLLSADPQITARIPQQDLAALFDMGYFQRHVDTIFTRVFGRADRNPSP